jgi:hypothetical protein
MTSISPGAGRRHSHSAAAAGGGVSVDSVLFGTPSGGRHWDEYRRSYACRSGAACVPKSTRIFYRYFFLGETGEGKD